MYIIVFWIKDRVVWWVSSKVKEENHAPAIRAST